MKESSQDKKGRPKTNKQKYNCGRNREKRNRRKFQKRLSLVTTEKCERLFHPLKKKRVSWKKNKHRIKERPWELQI